MTPESQINSEFRHSTSSLVGVLDRGFSRAEVLGLAGSSDAYLLSNLLSVQKRTFFILAPDQKQAARFAADLSFYCGRPEEIFLFPHWEVRPYEALSPHPEVEAGRIAALAALAENRARAVVFSIRALMQRVIPREVLEGLCERLRVEGEYPRSELLQRLSTLGYRSAPLVEDRGAFSSRGDILDLYPPTGELPVRVEFFGDQIERMRPFDLGTQRSREENLSELLLLPAREMVLSEAFMNGFSRRLKERCDVLGISRLRRESVLEEAREGILAPGRSFLLPYNYGKLDTLFDYLPAEGGWVLLDPSALEGEIDAFGTEIAQGEMRASNRGEPYAPAEALYLSPEMTMQKLEQSDPRLDLAPLEVFRLGSDRQVFRLHTEGNGDLRAHLEREEDGLGPLARHLREWTENRWRVLLVCHQRSQAERLLDLLEVYGLNPPFVPDGLSDGPGPGESQLVLGDLSAGFRIPEEKLAVVTEEEIFGRRARRRGASEARTRALLSSLAELKEGDFVVHADHGIARYRGLLHLEIGGTEGDFLHLEYADRDKLYLPVDRIEKVQKYVGAEGHGPRLDKMGGSAWEKAKLKARAAIEELARELLRIYARREMSQGFSYSPPDRLYREFEAAFPYEETPDQMSAIEEVLEDMQNERPMDRLVCGDVGYGKTEVAIRAAFKAVLDGKQVAVLVPTTVLASQHWETFRERFREHPVEVEMLSRFRTPAESKNVLKQTAEGRVDILVGTHRLLQRDVKFKNLGLIIIDEEQRFGVSHKERLKKLRSEVDVLTLTATPIPRTLHMGLMGLRSLSIIETPPVDRLAIRTYVTRFDDDLIREAIRRELHRGGQVFFVHNRVQSIGAMAEFLKTLVPEAKIAVGHGQMGEKELEKVMLEFIEGKTNVLVSTTIIENGLDIPRANTMIVNRADCFGLSQLYQLRGRVGRSSQRAYAYLLIPGEGTLTREARERLKVLQELTELGAGFRLASHDLELRGAGDLLGASQSGQIAAIGFEMYSELLEETVRELRGEKQEQRIDPEIRLGVSAFFPEKYIPDPNQRLVFYKRLAAAERDEDLYAAADELRDRYGELPEATVLLLEVMKLRVVMKGLKVETAEYDGRRLVFGFHPETPVPPENILGLMEKQKGKYSFSPDYRLSIRLDLTDRKEVPKSARKELQGLLQVC